jgi:excisionase family DNA binding protein
MLLSVTQAAAALGISKSVLYTLMTAGEIDHVRINGRRLLSRSALQDFIKVHTQTGY